MVLSLSLSSFQLTFSEENIFPGNVTQVENVDVSNFPNVRIESVVSNVVAPHSRVKMGDLKKINDFLHKYNIYQSTVLTFVFAPIEGRNCRKCETDKSKISHHIIVD